MKIAIFLGHPAQFHMFKHMAKNLRDKGHKVEFLVKRKDILEKLVKDSGFDYTIVRKQERQSSDTLTMICVVLKTAFNMLWYMLTRRPKIIIGTYGSIFAKMVPIKFIVCNEDDASVVPKFAKLAYPNASVILTPVSCDCGQWNDKAIKYAGFQKLAYLHPNVFTPDKSIVEKYFGKGYKPYVLMRFAKLNAHHDDGITGMTDQLAETVIERLSTKYNVYISSERPLTASLEKYRLHINLYDIHHLMAFADLFVGDSQSMSVESALLGIPNIRFNSFAGRIGVLKELEEKYHLTIGISSDKPDVLLETIDNFIRTPEILDQYKNNRQKLLQDKIDVTQFLTWFVDNYPESSQIMKDNPDYQYRFR